MKVEVGVNESSKKKLATTTWAGHVEKMGNKKRADAQKVEGIWRRGRLQLRWGNALKVT